MSRIVVWTFVIAFTRGISTAWSQQTHSGQGGAPTTAGGNQGTRTTANAAAGGQFNAGASSAARSAMPGQSGTVSDFGPAAPQQGQFLPNGQPVIGPTAGTGRFGASGQFFPDGQVAPRNQFTGGQASDSQFTGGQPTATGRLTTGGQLITGNQFTPGGAATTRFNQVFVNSPTPWFSSPSNRQQLGLSPNQYNNLYNAYIHANAGYNRAVAQLPAQDRRLRLMAAQWNQLALKLRERSSSGETIAAEEIEELNRELRRHVESTLTLDQQVSWQELVGPYYDLDAPAFLSQVPAQSEY